MHFVYTIYGHEDQVLYVGCTSNVGRRLYQQAKRRSRGKQIGRVEVAEYPNKRLALWAEARRIFQLQPEWNVKGKKGLMPAALNLSQNALP